MTGPRLVVRHLTKRFGALVANDDISLAVEAGELHCLLGENGAGKSTFSGCLYGLLQPDHGEIEIDGRKVELTSPAKAIACGIGMVHQHFVLVPSFTVLENIVVGTGSGLSLDTGVARRKILDLSRGFGLELKPDRLVSDLSVGEKQWVEIVKALYLGARLLILDEPTAVLTPQESERLFAVIAELKAAGIAVILISHKMNEVMRSDRVSVLRKGKLVGTVRTKDVTREDLTMMMVGRPVAQVHARAKAPHGEAALRVEGLSLTRGGRAYLSDIDLDIGAGEIVGIAGVAGNGQDELLEAIAGLARPDRGRMLLGPEDITRLSVQDIARRGVGYVPSDRFRDGLVSDFTIAENLILGQHWDEHWRSGPFLDDAATAKNAETAISSYSIMASGPDMLCGRLSGGNAQKVILAREFAKARHLLLCNQPTRGVDIGVIEFVHRELLRKREEGCAILLVSEELEDIFALSDRIAVMFRGEIMGVFPRAAANIAAIGPLMAGHRPEAAA
ncbi:ABC transporter ATP-binding protein [Taklimakanibacter deserti]|uniref:ABC transporter ATP-binding protein n=1 Tax=Taklimakanibacter deserti TaxID=2267839 RepID=UPI000E652585